MAAPVPLRTDFDAAQLRGLAKRSRDPDQTRRLLALAAIYDGATRTEAAKMGSVTLQIVCDSRAALRRQGSRGARHRPGAWASPLLNAAHRAALHQIVEQGPIPAEGKGAALVLPRCTTKGTSLHLAEIS